MFYVFLAQGFEEIEALSVVDILRRAGIETRTVGIGGTWITGSHGIRVETDLTDTLLPRQEPYQGLILPGGLPGTVNLEKSQVVRQMLRDAAAQDKYICAICAAPSVLGHLGLLRGKRATCYPGFEDALEGAQVSTEAVCSDGRVITAKGAGAALAFGFAIVSACKGEACARELARSMQCG